MIEKAHGKRFLISIVFCKCLNGWVGILGWLPGWLQVGWVGGWLVNGWVAGNWLVA